MAPCLLLIVRRKEESECLQIEPEFLLNQAREATDMSPMEYRRQTGGGEG